jgi:hypothetical protein
MLPGSYRAPVKATLLSLPASHPMLAARLMLERKGVGGAAGGPPAGAAQAAAAGPAARRLAWAALVRTRSTLETFLEDAHLGIRDDLAVTTSPPIVRIAALDNRAGDRSSRRDLAALGGMLNRVDELVEAGVVGGAEPNAADYQLATSVRLLGALDDLRPQIEPRPAGRLALQVVPRFPGRVPPGFPPEWLRSVRERP